MEKTEYPNPYLTMECLPNGQGCKMFVYLPKQDRIEELEAKEFGAMIYLLMSGEFNDLVNKALMASSKEHGQEVQTIISIINFLSHKQQEKDRTTKLVVPPTKAFFNPKHSDLE